MLTYCSLYVLMTVCVFVYYFKFYIFICKVQLTLVISTSVISNNRLSRRKNLVLVITQKSKIRL